MATLRISLKKITSEVKFAERKSALLRNYNVWKKLLPFVQSYKVSPPLHHPKNNFMTKWHLIQPFQREIYKEPMLISYILVRSKNLWSRITLYKACTYMCLACQHFDFNSADWISDNLHVISGRYLWTMGKEFIIQFSRRSWGRNAWRNPKDVCVRGYKIQCSQSLTNTCHLASFFIASPVGSCAHLFLSAC